MAIAKKIESPLRTVLSHAALIAVCAGFCLPFLWLVITSLKPKTEILQYPPTLWPSDVQPENYKAALEFIPFAQYTFNSLFVSLSGTIGMVVSCSLVAYGFAIVRWRWANAIFLLMLATLMLPPQVTLIPLFMVFKQLDWVGTFRPIVVPAFFGYAFYVFLLRQFFKTIPRDLVEAARIDGCSHFDIYLRVILPLTKPALSVVAFFTFTAFWNDFMTPLIYLNDQSKYTLSLGLQQFLGQFSAEWHLLMAAATMMTLPIVILFFFLQRTFVEGIALTGIKG